MIEIETPDGIAEFPDSMTDEEIQAILRREYAPEPTPEQQQGLNAVAQAANLSNRTINLTQQALDAADLPDENTPATPLPTSQFTIGRTPPPSILPAIGKGMQFAGKALVAGLADIGSDITGQTLREDPEELGNIESLVRGEPLPAETQMRALPAPLRVAGRAAQGLVEVTPQLAAMSGLQSAGVPMPVAAAAVFGTTPEGFDPEAAAIGAALPFVGRYGGQLAEAIAKKAGVSAEQALTFLNGSGATVAAAAYLATIQASEIASLPPEQREDAVIEAVAGVVGQSMLGPIGMKRRPPTREDVMRIAGLELGKNVEAAGLTGGESARRITGRNDPRLQPGFRLDTEAGRKLLADWEAAKEREAANALQQEGAQSVRDVREEPIQVAPEVPPEVRGAPIDVRGDQLPIERPNETKAPEAIADATGFTYDAGMEQMVPDRWHFTDRRAGSPTEALSVTVPKGGTAADVQAAIDAKVKEGFTPASVNAPKEAAAVEPPTDVSGEPTAAVEAKPQALSDVGESIDHPVVGQTFIIPRRARLADAPVDTTVTVVSVKRGPDTRGGSQTIQVEFSDGTTIGRNAGRQSDGTFVPVDGIVEQVLASRQAKPKPPAPSPAEPAKAAAKEPELVKAKPETPAAQPAKAVAKLKRFTNAEAESTIQDLYEGSFSPETESKVRQEIDQRITEKQRLKYSDALNAIDRRLEQKATESERVKRLTTPSTERVDLKHPAEESITLKEPKPAAPEPTPKAGETPVGEAGAGAIAKAPPLKPVAAPSNPTLTPKSQRQIIADLAKGLKLPIRFGRLTTRKFAGYFKPIANLIGSKKAVDVPTVSHEVGHKLDKTFKLSADKSIAAELDVLGDPATPGSGSSWTKSKSKAYKMGEGVAEFVRHWLTDPAKALKDAPNTHRAFEAALDANKDVGDVMRQARDDIQTWRHSEPQARLRSQIVSGNPNKTRYTGSQLIRDLVDDLHILRLATEHGAKAGPIDPSKNPYLLARNLRGSYGMADTFVRHGVADFNTKAVRIGTSLSDALKPVAGRLSDFRDWIVAKRAQELISQGRETGLVKSDVDAVAALFDGDAAFQKAFSDVKAWNDALLKYAEDAGFVTPESAAAMRKMNADYVPFHRVFEVGAGEAPSQQSTGTGMGLNVGKPGSLKRLKGSTRNIADPLETMVQNAYTLITASEKHAINRAVAEMSNLPDMGRWVERVAAPTEAVRVTADKIRKELEAAGADMSAVPDDLMVTFFRQGRTAPFGENTIRVVRNGKQEFYRLNRDLHDTFKALDLEDTGTLIRILSAPAQLLRSGVVLEPSFNIANVLRDTFSAAVIGKYGALPFETTLKGVAAMLTNPKAVAEWAASGGKNAVEAIYFDRARLQKFLAQKISKDLSPADRALIVAKSPLTTLRYLTSVFEEATRIGEYQIAFNKLTKSGMPEGEARRLAAFESRDRQDFAKGGAKTKIVRHLAAFWNAGLQANVKLAQAFKERPMRTTLQGLAFITIPKLLEQAINWDDDDYWERPQWERDLFFLIPVGKDETSHTRFLKLPTPFEVGIIFGTFPGRMLQWMKEHRPDAVADFPALMLKQSVPNPIPQSAQMIFEDFLSGKQGWDTYRGRTIVPDSLKDLPPDLQWTEQTSRIAKEIGSRVNFPPMKVDHIIEKTTGGLGKLATGRTQPFSRFVTRPLRVSNQSTEDFYVELEALRMQAARAALTGEAEPEWLTEFEPAARELAEMRREGRSTTDESKKAEIQEDMYRLTSQTMKRYRERTSP